MSRDSTLVDEHHPIISNLLEGVIASKTYRLVEQLCFAVDRDNGLSAEPGVRHAIKGMVDRGRFDEQHNTSALIDFVTATRFMLQAVEPALEGERPRRLPAGSPSQAHILFKTTLETELNRNPEFSELKRDKIFKVYIHRMSNLLAVRQVPTQILFGNTHIAELLLERLAAEYQLLADSELPKSLVKDSGHRRSVFEIQELYRQAKEHPVLADVYKTAARKVIVGSDDDLQAVARRYLTIQKNVEKIVKTYPALTPQAKSIAGLVLSGILPSVEFAGKRILQLNAEAEILAKANPKYRRFLASLVSAAVKSKRATIQDSKKRYDAAFSFIKKKAKGELANVLSPHGGALEVLVGNYPNAKTYVDACVAQAKLVEKSITTTSPYYGLRRTIMGVLLDGRYPSVESVLSVLEEASGQLKTLLKGDGCIPQGLLMGALLRKRFADAKAAFDNFRSVKEACREELQRRRIDHGQYGLIVAKYVFRRYYKTPKKAGSALLSCIMKVRKYRARNPTCRYSERSLVEPLFTRRVASVQDSVRYREQSSKERTRKRHDSKAT